MTIFVKIFNHQISVKIINQQKPDLFEWWVAVFNPLFKKGVIMRLDIRKSGIG